MKISIVRFLGPDYHPIFLIFILLFYLISQLSIFDKPGLQEDEANIVVPAMEPANGKEISNEYGFNHFGFHDPTMIGPYTGNTLTIPVAFVVRVFGFNLVLVRLLWVITSLVGILLVFLVSRELFNQQV